MTPIAQASIETTKSMTTPLAMRRRLRVSGMSESRTALTWAAMTSMTKADGISTSHCGRIVAAARITR
jgi:hypothetical protein